MGNRTHKIEMTRFSKGVKITCPFGNISIDDFIASCEDNDFSLDSHVTGHLMLIDDRYNLTYMLNDYGVDVIDQLNETGNFTAPMSILDYADFKV